MSLAELQRWSGFQVVHKVISSSQRAFYMEVNGSEGTRFHIESKVSLTLTVAALLLCAALHRFDIA